MQRLLLSIRRTNTAYFSISKCLQAFDDLGAWWALATIDASAQLGRGAGLPTIACEASEHTQTLHSCPECYRIKLTPANRLSELMVQSWPACISQLGGLTRHLTLLQKAYFYSCIFAGSPGDMGAQSAKQLYLQAKEAGALQDTIGYNIVISALGELFSQSLPEDVFVARRDVLVNKDAAVWHNACRPEQRPFMHYAMIPHSSTLAKTLVLRIAESIQHIGLMTVGQAGHLGLAQQVFAEMQGQGWPADVYTFTALIKACQVSGCKWQLALKYLHQMKQQGTPLPPPPPPPSFYHEEQSRLVPAVKSRYSKIPLKGSLFRETLSKGNSCLWEINAPFQ